MSLEDAQRVVEKFVGVYNTERLHSAIGYITTRDKLKGREAWIFAARQRKLTVVDGMLEANRSYG